MCLGGCLWGPSQRWHGSHLAPSQNHFGAGGRLVPCHVAGGFTPRLCRPKTGRHRGRLGPSTLWRGRSAAAKCPAASCLFRGLCGVASRWVCADLGGCALRRRCHGVEGAAGRCAETVPI